MISEGGGGTGGGGGEKGGGGGAGGGGRKVHCTVSAEGVLTNEVFATLDQDF